MFFGKNIGDVFFKPVPGGRAFYPYGALTSGRLVGPDTEEALKRFLGRWFAAASTLIVAQIVLQPFLGTEPAFIIIAGPGLLALLLVYYLAIKRLLRGCPRASVRLSRDEILRGQARVYSRGRIGFLLFAGIVMTAASAFILIASLSHPGATTLFGAFATIFFGYGLHVAIRIARYRSRTVD